MNDGLSQMWNWKRNYVETNFPQGYTKNNIPSHFQVKSLKQTTK